MKNTKRAMITVEASLILPLFITAIYFFLYFYQVLMLQEVIHYDATKVVKEVSSYGTLTNLLMSESTNQEVSIQELIGTEEGSCVTEMLGDVDVSAITGNVIDSLFFSYKMANDLEPLMIIRRCIKGGYDGILFYGSSLYDEEECVTLCMTYEIEFPIFQRILPTLPVIQTVRMRSFNGYAVASKAQEVPQEGEEDKTQEEMVYITKKGTVYHTNRSCIYLNISVSQCPYASVDSMRNNSGGKYYPCEKCFKNGAPIPSIVYITKSGERYHINSSCTAISRSVMTVPLSEVSDRRLCKRCQQYH